MFFIIFKQITFQIFSSNLLLLIKYFEVIFQSLISKKSKLLNYSSMIHSEFCSPTHFPNEEKFNIAKLKIKPTSGPVGFLYFLSVPDPSGDYLLYANLALTIIMYIKNTIL